MSRPLDVVASPSFPRLRVFPSTLWFARLARVLGIVCLIYYATLGARILYIKYLTSKAEAIQRDIHFDDEQRKEADVLNQIKAIQNRGIFSSEEARLQLRRLKPRNPDQAPQQTPPASSEPTASVTPTKLLTEPMPSPVSIPAPLSAQRQQWENDLTVLNQKKAKMFQLDMRVAGWMTHSPLGMFVRRVGEWIGHTRLGLFVTKAIDFSYIVIFIVCALPFTPHFLLLIGRRLNIVSVRRVLKNDSRLPILYLRSFQHDNRRDRVDNKPTNDTEEELFVRALNKTGPVIAIGRPKEMLPPVGAARFYVSNEEWQRAVEIIMPHCRAVVLRIGRTQGLHWEIGQLRKTYFPQRLALYCPPTESEQDYFAFRQNMKQKFGIDLPSTLYYPIFTGEYENEYNAQRESMKQKYGVDLPEMKLYTSHILFDGAWRASLFTGNDEGLAQTFAQVSLPSDAQLKWRDTARKLGLIS